MRRIAIAFCAAFLLAACNEPYDPIGPNKPAPVLLISPLELAWNGSGGSLTSTVSTNAEQISVGDLPDWVESATVSDDLTAINVVAKPNSSSLKPRQGVIPLFCSSGDNSVTQYLKLFQAGNGCKIAYTSFSGKNLPSGWTAEDPSRVAAGNGYLSMKAEGNPGYLYTFNESFNPTGRRFFFSVDIKMNGGEGGAKLFVNNNPEDIWEIYLGYNSSTKRGGIWVKKGSNWNAMDDGTIGSGSCPNQYEEMIAIPEEGDRDDWWRLEVYSTDTDPTHPVVSVAILKTFNGNVQRLGAAYSRKFSDITAGDGRIALWGRNYETQYKNFILSYQE